MIHLISPDGTEVLLSKDGDLCRIRVYTPTTGWGVESTLPRGHEAAYELLFIAMREGIRPDGSAISAWVLHPESPENFEEFIVR